MQHSFTDEILTILKNHFGDNANQIFDSSPLIQYLNKKTVSANKGSKARSSWGNIYTIYTLVEDYLNKGYFDEGDYSKDDGARFTDLKKRANELRFGDRLQNHSFNHRVNTEFTKNFPLLDIVPVVRNMETTRYFIHEGLLKINANNETHNIGKAIIDIVHRYIEVKTASFDRFIATCEKLKEAENKKPKETKDFILSLLAPNMDARIFEIVSYAILKADYNEQIVFWGYTEETVEPENLKLYKTGRTNANDGGIDFVMKPVGRFFQVTETTDVRKYFLDIDKLEKFPITFVVKSTESTEALLGKIRESAKKKYSIEAVINKYIECVEEIINIQRLTEAVDSLGEKGKLPEVLSEIIKQSKVEFNCE